MKNILYKLFSVALLFSLIAVIYTVFSVNPENASTQTSKKTNKPIESVYDVIQNKLNYEKFDKINLFALSANTGKSSAILNTVNKYTGLNLNKKSLAELYQSNKQNIEISLPVENSKSVKLILSKYDLLSDDFRLTSLSSSGELTEQFKKGLYYRGIIEGSTKSLAAVSIFENNIIGIISDEKGTYNLNPFDEKDFNSEYIYYNDKDLKAKNNFKCGIDGKDLKFYKSSPKNENPEMGILSARQPVRIYIEADYKLYQDKGSSVPNTSSFITAYYNSVAAIYQNEYLPIVISQISVWNTPDPYRNLTSTIDYLTAFGQNKKDNFNGDLAQLLSSRPLNLGGIAWINTLCANYNAQDQSGRFSFCNIEVSYQPYPTYSWTTMVSTHELGHNFGSMHTHACWWPVRGANNHNPIDSCYYAEEGNCFSGTYPATGTIMSYCHLQEQYGGSIDPTLGFGPMPGDTIRLRYNQCAKFGSVINSSELPVVYDMMQNYPNPFNPVTAINIAIPEISSVSLKIYNINGREVASILSSELKNAGYHLIRFNASQYSLASGIYFYRITANAVNSNNKFTETKRMILIK